jgi:hypothetical protein
MDYKSTYLNCVTAVTPEKGRLPIVCDNDREALEFAMVTSGPVTEKNVRVVWIKNTSTLDEMFVSKPFLEEIQKKDNLEIIDEKVEMSFDENGNLSKPW